LRQCGRHLRWNGPFAGLMEKIMSKSSRATPTIELVRELRDDELQEVSGGYNFYNLLVESIVAPRDLNSGHTVGLVAPLMPRFDE
jgi:hypothetical protein